MAETLKRVQRNVKETIAINMRAAIRYTGYGEYLHLECGGGVNLMVE
jgi:hypothetical protein